MSAIHIPTSDVVAAFGVDEYNQLFDSTLVQKVRSLIHNVGKLFGIRIYGKVILDSRSVIYINKCQLTSMTPDATVSWNKPGFVANFAAYVKKVNLYHHFGRLVDDVYTTRATKFVTGMLARNNRQLTQAGKIRLARLIITTLPTFKMTENNVKNATRIAQNLTGNLTDEEKTIEGLLLDDIKKVIFKEAREIFIRGQRAQKFTQEINQI